MKRKIGIWVLIIVIIGGFIFFRMSAKNKGKEISVKTMAVSQGDIKSYLSTTGTVKSKNSKDYYSLQGKVKKVNVKVGDFVNEGQVLIEYDIVDASIAVKQAQIQYDNAILSKQMLVNNNTDIKNKISEIDKQIENTNNMIQQAQVNQALSAEAASLQAQLEKLKQSKEGLKPISTEQLKQADNAISLAKLGLDNAKQNLSKSQDKITSDIKGVVTGLTAVEGSTAMAAQPAITIQDIENLKVLVSVGKYDAGRIRLNQEAVVRSGNKDFKARVSAIDPAAKKALSATGTETTLGVEIELLEKADELKIDFDTDVDILLGQVNNVVKVPAESIRTNKEGKTYVYIVQNSKALEKEVKLGLQSDMEAQIIEGVNVGEKVILNPIESIKNGVTVKEAVGDEK